MATASAPPPPLRLTLLCCQTQRFGTTAECCGRNKAGEIMAFLIQEIRAQGLETWVVVKESPCFGHCSQGPVIRWVGNELYTRVSRSQVLDLVNTLRCHLQDQGVDLNSQIKHADDENPGYLLPPV